MVAIFGRFRPYTRMRIARALGRLASVLLPIRRGLIREQLAVALPELGPAERDRMIPAIYANLFAFGQEVMAMRSLSQEALAGMIEIGPELARKIERIKSEKKGVILTSGHMGNWEYAGSALRLHGLSITAAAKPMHNPWSERFIREARERFGMKIVSTRGSMAPLVRTLRSGGMVGLMADQDARSGGVFVDFFGRKASTAMGPAWLAWRLGVSILPVYGFRLPDGRLRYEAGEEITPQPDAPESEEVLRMTAAHVKALEEAIRLDPTQYFWFHRRWKTRPKSERGRRIAPAEEAIEPRGDGVEVGNF